MKNKPPITGIDLENLAGLAMLVGRFEEMQKYDMDKSSLTIEEFKDRFWQDNNEFRKDINRLAKDYPTFREYRHRMFDIIRKQMEYDSS